MTNSHAFINIKEKKNNKNEPFILFRMDILRWDWAKPPIDSINKHFSDFYITKSDLWCYYCFFFVTLLSLSISFDICSSCFVLNFSPTTRRQRQRWRRRSRREEEEKKNIHQRMSRCCVPLKLSYLNNNIKHFSIISKSHSLRKLHGVREWMNEQARSSWANNSHT